MKNIYRQGLGYRYGRQMQIIAGVHFNYSLPAAFWPAYQATLGDQQSITAFRSEHYLGMIRNFRRMGWIVLYLFGSSPAVCKSFAGGAAKLPSLNADTWFEPYATSLRMSDLGYSNQNQSRINISLNSLDEYVRDLTDAISTLEPAYEEIGVKVDGEYRQLNANLLQIENEYYSPVRPKRVARSGEQPTAALRRDGIEYVEIRSLDINMFDPTGINQNTMRFIEVFLIYCLLEDSPALDETALGEASRNHTATAKRGRDPEFRLSRDGEALTVRDWATEILDNVLAVAEIIDGHENDQCYSDAVRSLRGHVDHPESTISARIINELQATGSSFFEFALGMAKCHRDYFASIAPLRDVQVARFTQEAADSVQRQEEVEADDDITLEEYLQRYFQSC
jgi:glutamate--cysteine ligase